VVGVDVDMIGDVEVLEGAEWIVQVDAEHNVVRAVDACVVTGDDVLAVSQLDVGDSNEVVDVRNIVRGPLGVVMLALDGRDSVLRMVDSMLLVVADRDCIRDIRA